MDLKIKIADPRLLASGNQIGYASSGAAGIDLRACGYRDIEERIKPITHDIKVYPGDEIFLSAGFSMALPDYAAALLIPRSGLGAKEGIVLGNLVGLVDSDYRNHVGLAIWYRKAHSNKGKSFLIEPMMRIAQMMIVPVYRPDFEIVPELPETARGLGGWGSTGVV